MLVSEVPMFALKFKTFAWSQNKLRYSFLLLSILLIVLTGIPGISLAIILYVLLSLFNNRK
jgi:CDP-diacylglycerol---serine O-phosphatidyltransferase